MDILPCIVDTLGCMTAMHTDCVKTALVFLAIVILAGNSCWAYPIEFASCTQVRNCSCPDNDFIKFNLYTRLNRNVGERLNILEDNVTYSNFNASNPTKIIIHGFMSDPKLYALVNIRKAYLTAGNFNVIAVDWSKLSAGPFVCYPTAVNNARCVGKCIAQLIQWLRDIGASDIHVIGFSLGGQVAGFAANNLRPYRLPRITGLDPAMPLFVTSDKDDKLDATDATFVDVFHTNALMQGKIEESGHVDFYFNGGTFQPGCGYLRQDTSACSHVRAPLYFAESIITSKGFWGWHCSGYMAYMLGICSVSTSPEVLIGEHVSHKLRGFFGVSTRSESPYALGPTSNAATPSQTIEEESTSSYSTFATVSSSTIPTD